MYSTPAECWYLFAFLCQWRSSGNWIHCETEKIYIQIADIILQHSNANNPVNVCSRSMKRMTYDDIQIFAWTSSSTNSTYSQLSLKFSTRLQFTPMYCLHLKSIIDKILTTHWRVKLAWKRVPACTLCASEQGKPASDDDNGRLGIQTWRLGHH